MRRIISWFKDYFGNIQKSLLWLLFGVLIYVLLTDLFIRNSLIQNSFLEHFVNCIYTLGLSYIASFIFYFIQVHLKQKKEQNKINPSIERIFSRLLQYLNDIGIDIIHNVEPDNKLKTLSDISEKDFLPYISKVRFDLGSHIYQGDTELSWLQYFSIRKEQIEEYRRILLDYIQYLDEDCITLLADIRDDQILYIMTPNSILCQKAGINSSFNLSGAETYCKQFYSLVVRVNNYYKNKLLPYRKKGLKPITAIYQGCHKQVTL